MKRNRKTDEVGSKPTNRKSFQMIFAATAIGTALLLCIAVGATNKERSIDADAEPIVKPAVGEPPRTVVASQPSPPPVAPAQQNNPKPEILETKIVTIEPHGFEPNSLTLPHKSFILKVNNRSGVRGITFRLDRETGDRLREVNTSKDVLDWLDRFDLPPGKYVLSEAAHPQWKCAIEVTPK